MYHIFAYAGVATKRRWAAAPGLGMAGKFVATSGKQQTGAVGQPQRDSVSLSGMGNGGRVMMEVNVVNQSNRRAISERAQRSNAQVRMARLHAACAKAATFGGTVGVAGNSDIDLRRTWRSHSGEEGRWQQQHQASRATFPPPRLHRPPAPPAVLAGALKEGRGGRRLPDVGKNRGDPTHTGAGRATAPPPADCLPPPPRPLPLPRLWKRTARATLHCLHHCHLILRMYAPAALHAPLRTFHTARNAARRTYSEWAGIR